MSEKAVTEERMKKASTTLATMLDYLGLEANIKSEESRGNISLMTSSDDAGRIIGRKGQTLSNLQLLVNKMMQKSDMDFPRIFIDVDGYSRNNFRHERSGDPRDRRHSRRDYDDERSDERSDERDEQIRQQAMDASKEVKRWGEPITLPPMNSHERRIVHIALEEDSEISTESIDAEGDSRVKKVKISLNEKPEEKKEV